MKETGREKRHPEGERKRERKTPGEKRDSVCLVPRGRKGKKKKDGKRNEKAEREKGMKVGKERERQGETGREKIKPRGRKEKKKKVTGREKWSGSSATGMEKRYGKERGGGRKETPRGRKGKRKKETGRKKRHGGKGKRKKDIDSLTISNPTMQKSQGEVRALTILVQMKLSVKHPDSPRATSYPIIRKQSSIILLRCGQSRLVGGEKTGEAILRRGERGAHGARASIGQLQTCCGHCHSLTPSTTRLRPHLLRSIFVM